MMQKYAAQRVGLSNGVKRKRTLTLQSRVKSNEYRQGFKVKDFKLTISSLGYFIAELTKMITTEPNKAWRITVKGWRESRSLNQNSLYWKWMAEICPQWGVTKDPEIQHEIFKKYFCPEKVINEYITVKSTKKLDVGEMHFYLNKIERFCMDRGYMITIPSDCEYQQLIDKQDK